MIFIKAFLLPFLFCGFYLLKCAVSDNSACAGCVHFTDKGDQQIRDGARKPPAWWLESKIKEARASGHIKPEFINFFNLLGGKEHEFAEAYVRLSPPGNRACKTVGIC